MQRTLVLGQWSPRTLSSDPLFLTCFLCLESLRRHTRIAFSVHVSLLVLRALDDALSFDVALLSHSIEAN